LIENAVCRRKWALDQDKLVAFQIDKSFHAAADQAHRHRIQQFVGEMNADEWLQGSVPFDLVAKQFECPRLPLLQSRKWLDYSVAQSREEFRRVFLCKFENVTRELSMVRALLDNDEIVDPTESLPDFGELHGQKLAEQRANAHVGEIVAFPPNRAAPGGIVSVLRMIERLLHKPSKRDRAVRTDGLTYQFGQLVFNQKTS